MEPGDFTEACQRISFLDEWFPLPVRLIEMCDECARERRQRERIRALPAPSRTVPLVCPHCHGARWIRLGGPSHIKTKPGANEGDRIQSCPHCTTNGRHDLSKETRTVGRDGGVPDPSFSREPDMTRSTWSAPRRDDGSIDLDAIYRESRIMRGLDPNVDERVQPAAGFATIAGILSRRTGDSEVYAEYATDESTE